MQISEILIDPQEESSTSLGELRLADKDKKRFELPLLVPIQEELERGWVGAFSYWELWVKSQPGFPSSSSILMEIDTLLTWLLSNHVRLSEPDHIREYLLQFPDLMDVIPLAVNATRTSLPRAQLVLEVYQDPEIEDRYLALYVRLKRYDESVIERIEAAEAEFIDLLADKEGWLQLTTDFQEPEAGDAL